MHGVPGEAQQDYLLLLPPPEARARSQKPPWTLLVCCKVQIELHKTPPLTSERRAA